MDERGSPGDVQRPDEPSGEAVRIRDDCLLAPAPGTDLEQIYVLWAYILDILCPKENLHRRFDSIPYGAVSAVFPVESLPVGTWHQHDAAAERLESTPESDVLAVAPESMATGYKLAQSPLTVVSLDALPQRAAPEVLDELPARVREYSILVFGRPATAENRRLREYVSSA